MRHTRIPQYLILALAFPAAASLAQDSEEIAAGDDPLEGHSHYGEAFNEGPRQRAYLMPDWNKVSFPVTTSSEEAQRFVHQGMGQLHGFWYFESERSFRQAAALDPECAMAYWGMAMANVENEERSAGFTREAYLRRDGVSHREQLYIDALARYHAVDYPAPVSAPLDAAPVEAGAAVDSEEGDSEEGDSEAEDAEAEDQEGEDGPATEKQLLADRKPEKDKKKRADTFVKGMEEILFEYPDDIEAKALLVNQLWLGRSITSRQANQALLDQVFAASPMHPAHHYRIHLWDSPETAKRVTDSAARVGQSYPSIAHNWHMGGHIWARLGRHSDAAWQQEASARVDHAYMMRDMVLPDQIHNFAHNNEWLTRSLRHSGRVTESIDLAKNMIELPRHPKYNRLDKGGTSSSYGRRRLIETLSLYEAWDELIALSETMYLERSEEADDQADRAYLLGQAHAFSGDLAACSQVTDELRELLKAAETKRLDAALAAEAEALEADKKESKIHDLMRDALEDNVKPVRDLQKKIGALDALVAVLKGNDVEESLKTLEDARMSRIQLSRLYLEVAGDAEKALELARKAADKQVGIAVPHANLAYVLSEAGEKEAAAEEFELLRSFSSRFDLEYAPFKRLAPLAAELGHTADWRVPVELAEDIGERVDLANLGPFRWSPVEAPDWRLPDGLGAKVSLADYAGKPKIVIFFLGFGCVHCVEQLQAFAPAAAAYQEAGIPIVTIGTDTLEELIQSQAGDTPEERYPFPILADPDHDVFKLYRCYDDFENMALHGTFLLDGEDRIRWQDISYEPFTDTEFLLEEAQRLLGLPDPRG